jgi:glutamyl/glutaminyl-tRNA synthetase
MEITHALRGEEWISSTPKHLALYSFFGWKPTEYAHMPLILKPGGGKLSKRDMATSAMGYIEEGYSKEALLNFVALLGWHPKGDKEQMTMDEMIAEFDMAQVNSAGAIFTTDKLDWLNGLFIRSLTPAEFAKRARPYMEKAGLINSSFPEEKLVKYAALEQSRIKKFTELPEAVGFMFNAPTPAKEIICWKKQEPNAAAERLEALVVFIDGLKDSDFTVPKLEAVIKEFIASSGASTGETLWPMRVALSGREASPGPFEIAAALGKSESVSRIKNAISILRG